MWVWRNTSWMASLLQKLIAEKSYLSIFGEMLMQPKLDRAPFG